MFGSHLSIAGSMTSALLEAERLGFDTVQVFTKNQQQWVAKPLEQGAIDEWMRELRRLGWQDRTVSHASYLINLASKDDALFAKSLDLMTIELERCEALSIPYLVHHPGSFVGWTLEQGIDRIASGYGELARRTRGFRTALCLEGTAGAGSHIGGRFEHLADIRARAIGAGMPEHRVQYCLDTCHLLVAGYDVSTLAGGRAVIDEFDAICGLPNLKVWHLNDSKGKLASHLDRHEHIGMGYVGGIPGKHGGLGKFSEKRLADSGFAAICQDPRFAQIPKILETPKEDAKALAKAAIEDRLDVVNLRRLCALAEGGAVRTRVRARKARAAPASIAREVATKKRT
jgi:deoxyribonuclease-4